MKEQIPFHDLICMSCRSAADGVRLPSLDYAIAEIVVEMNDGTQVAIPIDITEFDVEYQSAGRSSARVLARVPCPSCQSSHRIDISAVRRAPVLELRRTTCPNCDKAVCEISKGPKISYREKSPGDAWVEVSAELTCPSCGHGTARTGSLDPGIFDVEGDNALLVELEDRPAEK
jgi:RNase P subunit RPR2